MEAVCCSVSWTSYQHHPYEALLISLLVLFSFLHLNPPPPSNSNEGPTTSSNSPQEKKIHTHTCISICQYLYFDLIPVFRSVNIWFTIPQINLYSTRHEHTCTLDTCTTQNNKVVKNIENNLTKRE